MATKQTATKTVLSPAQKAWATRKANAAKTSTPKAKTVMSAAQKAWVTRRKNATPSQFSGKVTLSSTPAGRAIISSAKKEIGSVFNSAKKTLKMAKSALERSIPLEGTRRLRASVPTLVGHLNSAKSLEYYYSANRSIIVVNS